MAVSPAPVTALPRLVLFTRSMAQPALVEAMDVALRTSTECQYRPTDSIAQVKEIVSRSTRVVLLANCLTKEDITDLFNALPALSARIVEGTVRVFVLNSIRHPKLAELLRSRGNVDVVDLPTTQKALQYKIKNALISVHQSYLKKDQAKEAQTPIEVTAQQAKASLRSAARNKDLDILWQSPVGFDFDFWWLVSPKNIRRVVGVWLVDLIGPGPSAGTWEEVPGFDRGGEKAWMWRTRWLADEAFQTTDGRWFFFGKQPEFSWQKAMWSFVSKNPMLAFFPNGARDPKYTRFEYKADDGFIFFENSHLTQLLLPRIQATLERRIGGGSNSNDVPEIVDALDQFDEFELPPSLDEAEIAASETVVVEPTEAITDEPPSGILRDNADFNPETVTPERSVLSVNPAIALPFGMGPIQNAGISAGSAAYVQTSGTGRSRSATATGTAARKGSSAAAGSAAPTPRARSCAARRPSINARRRARSARPPAIAARTRARTYAWAGSARSPSPEEVSIRRCARCLDRLGTQG